MIGRDPKWVAAQIGHVNPKFTFSVYQQVATRGYIDEQAVWALMRFADEPAERVPSRQITRLQRDDAGIIGDRAGRVRPRHRAPDRRRGCRRVTERRV